MCQLLSFHPGMKKDEENGKMKNDGGDSQPHLELADRDGDVADPGTPGGGRGGGVQPGEQAERLAEDLWGRRKDIFIDVGRDQLVICTNDS